MSYGDPSRYLEKIYVEEDCYNLPYTKEIIARSGLPVTVLPNRQEPDICGNYPDNLPQGKQNLFLCRNRGKFFKPCPATKEYRCCDYQVLNIGMNCPMDCVYCILQSYLNNPWISYFVNIDDLFKELDETLLSNQHPFQRIGTGEFTDSMALDRLTGLSKHLVEYFSKKDNCILELKTKSVIIQNLESLEHNGRTVVSWSLNSPPIMAREEIRAASLQERLEAAVQCSFWGYKLGFHFDPIVYHDGWQEGYRETIRNLFQAVDKDSIAWISMGALRYIPTLKTIATRRFPHSSIFYEEFIDGLDGKLRYFRSLRVEMYTFIATEILKYIGPKTCLYFCMESDEVWKEVMGFTPEEKGGLPAMLDKTMC